MAGAQRKRSAVYLLKTTKGFVVVVVVQTVKPDFFEK